MKTTIVVLACVLTVAMLPCAVQAKGLVLYPMGGYQFSIGGNQGALDGGPIVGGRVEYNFSRYNVSAVGVGYAFSKHDFQDWPGSLEQHWCLLGYRFGYNWTWVGVGSMVGTGAVVREHVGNPFEGTSAQYAMQLGVHVSFRPFEWMEIGPDFSYMMSTDMNKWIFGGETSYFINVGGHVGIYF